MRSSAAHTARLTPDETYRRSREFTTVETGLRGVGR